MKREFKVGDRVRIRQWDDMMEEFGIDNDGDIQLSAEVFTNDMRELCGKIATVIYALKNKEVSLDFDDIDAEESNQWRYTLDMIEHIETEKHNN